MHLNDETKPALMPDAKIRRMTESNVKKLRRPLQSASTSQQKTTLCKSNSIQDGTCRKNRPTPPTSIPDTTGKSARLSPRAGDTSPSSELEPGAIERSARDVARVDLEFLCNLVRFETRPTHPSRHRECEALFRCIRTDADSQASEYSNHCGDDMRFHQTLSDSIRTVDGSPETTYDSRANLKLAPCALN